MQKTVGMVPSLHKRYMPAVLQNYHRVQVLYIWPTESIFQVVIWTKYSCAYQEVNCLLLWYDFCYLFLLPSTFTLFVTQKSFRECCQTERSHCFAVDLGEKLSAHKKQKRIFKRLTIRDQTLYNVFPSIQVDYLTAMIKKHLVIPGDCDYSSRDLHVMVDGIVLVDSTRLFQAFHIASYLFRTDNIHHNLVRNELIFQDFASALAV